MTFARWEPSLALGIAPLDAQHEALFEAIHRLGRGMKRGEAGVELRRMADFLAEYIETHFREEEALMAEARFPGLVNHQALHRNLAARVARFREQVAAGQSAVDLELVTFLSRWLRDHILTQDRTFGQFLSDLGPAEELPRH